MVFNHALSFYCAKNYVGYYEYSRVSDIFTDRKMSLSDKESAIVVYSPALDDGGDGRVAAVAGLRMDEALRVAKGSVKVLRISVL